MIIWIHSIIHAGSCFVKSHICLLQTNKECDSFHLSVAQQIMPLTYRYHGLQVSPFLSFFLLFLISPFLPLFFTFTLLICESKVHFWTGKYFCHKLLIILHLYPNSVYFGELEYVSYSSGSNTKPQYCAVHDSSMSFNKNIDWINEYSSK